MEQKEQDIRWLRIKLMESKDENDRKYILKQLELLEAKDTIENQTLLAE